MKQLDTYNFSLWLHVNDDGTLDKGITITITTPHGLEEIQGRVNYEGFRKYITDLYARSDALIAREAHAQAQARHFEEHSKKEAAREAA